MPRTVRIDGIPVELPDGVEAARIAYERSLGLGRLAVVPSLLARSHVRVMFRGSGTVREVEVGNRNYAMHPFAQAEGRVYWVGCELELEPVLTKHEFSSIGLIIVLQRSDDVEPVLRAEWALSRESPPGPHAQPHWHVYLTAAEHQARIRLLTLENDEWRAIGDDWLPIDNADVASTEQQSVARFHLAMAAQWHLRSEYAHYEAPDDQKVADWITGCLAYTRSQLTYITKALAPRTPF